MKPSQAFQAINFLLDRKRPAFLWGAPGIGKSDLIRSIAQHRGIQLIDKRLSQSDPTELKGFPMPNSKKGVMEFLPDGELPTNGEGILFLDELPNAAPAVQAPAYQLVLDRRLGSYQLPDGWLIVAAGNETKHRSHTYNLSMALASRFQHIRMAPDIEDWMTWAIDNDVSPVTRGYLRFRPANLFTDDFKGVELAFPNPRAWVKADEIAADKTLDPVVRTEMLIGTIGEGCAVEFEGFARAEAELPDIKEILAKPDRAPVPDQPAMCYAVIAHLEGLVSTKNFKTLLTYVGRMPKEFEVVFVHACVSRNKPLQSDSTYTIWLTKNYELVAGR